MAKLMALVCLAAWLLVALIASVSAFGKKAEKVESIEAIDPEDRSKNEWKALARGYIKVISKKADGMGLDEVVQHIKKLEGTFKEAKGVKSEVPYSWEYLIYLRHDLARCRTGRETTVYFLATIQKWRRWQFNYALDCFKEHLKNCNYENTYKKALDVMKDADLGLEKYPTFDSYLRGEVWTLNFRKYESYKKEFESTDKMLSDIVTLAEASEARIHCFGENILHQLKKIEAYKKHPMLYKFHQYYNQLFLTRCGFQALFEKAIGNMKDGKWDKTKYSTLHSYLIGEYYPQLPKDETASIKNMESFLDHLKDLAEFDSSFDEKKCGDQSFKERLVKKLAETRVHNPQLHELEKHYFELYLHKCDYEEKFKAAMIRHGEAIDGGDSPFASYLWGEHSKKIAEGKLDYSEEILYALMIVPSLMDLETLERTWCKVGYIDFYVENRDRVRKVQYTKFIKALDVVFANYLKVCVDDFKAKAKKLEADNNEGLAFVKELAERMKTRVETKHKDEDRPSREIIEESLAVINKQERMKEQRPVYALEARDLLGDLKYNCLLMQDEIGPGVKALSYDFCPAIQDDEIRDFLNILGYCYLRKLNSDIDEAVLSMFDKFGAPYYPTKAPAPTVQPGECRRWQ